MILIQEEMLFPFWQIKTLRYIKQPRSNNQERKKLYLIEKSERSC